jgi:hypothetical protein
MEYAVSGAVRAKKFLWTYCKPLFMVIRRFRRARRQALDQAESVQRKAAFQAFVERYGAVVQGGPFRGMRYLTESLGSPLLPKLAGSYEAEIHPAIEEICKTGKPINIIDIGCDEGYYVVGMALRMPSARVFGFDINTASQEKCRQLARMNGVEDRVTVEGLLTPSRLNEILQPGDLVICDCEGCEYALIDPAQAPALRNVNMIVELHDSDLLELNITPTILSRFRESHTVELKTTGPRDASQWPAVGFLDSPLRELAIDEGRVKGQQWAWLKAKRHLAVARPA